MKSKARENYTVDYWQLECERPIENVYRYRWAHTHTYIGIEKNNDEISSLP